MAQQYVYNADLRLNVEIRRMIMINFKRTNRQYIVKVDGVPHTFDHSLDAWTFIFAMKGGVR